MSHRLSVAVSLCAALTITAALTAAPAHASERAAGQKCTKAGATVRVIPVAGGNDYTDLRCARVGKGTAAALRWKRVRDGKFVSSLLNVTQIWKGNSVQLFIYDAQGRECFSDEAKVVGQECAGFYLGWAANFKDDDRTITYGPEGIGTTISGLKPGDQGHFQLKYQEPGNEKAPIIIVKRFPFRYGD